MPGIHPLNKCAIYKITKKTGSVLNKKPERKCLVLTEEKLEEIGAQLEVRPLKSLSLLAVQCRISRTMAHVIIELLQLKLYIIWNVCNSLPPSNEVRIQVFQQSVHDDFLNPGFTFF